MTSDEFDQAKQIIKNTLSKRDGIGTGGQREDKVFGSLNTQVNTVASADTVWTQLIQSKASRSYV